MPTPDPTPIPHTFTRRYRNFRTFTSPRPVQFSCLTLDPSGEVVCAASHDTFEIFVWSMQTGRLLEVCPRWLELITANLHNDWSYGRAECNMHGWPIVQIGVPVRVCQVYWLLTLHAASRWFLWAGGREGVCVRLRKCRFVSDWACIIISVGHCGIHLVPYVQSVIECVISFKHVLYLNLLSLK